MLRSLASFVCLAAGIAVWAAPVSAQGLEDLHTQRAEGGRWCMADHFHDGSSSGLSTRQAAEQSAAASWSGFTALEYGNQWGSWRIAASKKMNCSQLNGSWGCQIEARPCRPLAGAGPSRRAARPKAKQ